MNSNDQKPCHRLTLVASSPVSWALTSMRSPELSAETWALTATCHARCTQTTRPSALLHRIKQPLQMRSAAPCRPAHGPWASHPLSL